MPYIYNIHEYTQLTFSFRFKIVTMKYIQNSLAIRAQCEFIFWVGGIR